MIYVKNLPWWERSLRIGLGTAAAAYAVFNVDSILAWTIAAGGVGATVTGLFGFCPACALAGRRLEKRARQGHLPQ